MVKIITMSTQFIISSSVFILGMHVGLLVVFLMMWYLFAMDALDKKALLNTIIAVHVFVVI